MRTMITTVIQMAKGMFELVGILGIASGRWGVGGVFFTARIPILEHLYSQAQRMGYGRSSVLELIAKNACRNKKGFFSTHAIQKSFPPFRGITIVIPLFNRLVPVDYKKRVVLHSF